MSNAAVYETGSNDISYFLMSCTKTGNKYVDGVTGGSVSVSSALFSVKWTEDAADRVLDGKGNRIGYNKKVSDLIECGPGAVRDKTSKADSERAVRIRNKLTSITYSQAENYIDKNVTDLESAKEFLKKLSKAVIAMARIEDE